jgi:asparagine synthase (glutamine-hydrolysing)
MVHSLEVREPLLDHRLVESVLRIPDTIKSRGSRSKPLLRAAVGERLPDLVRRRSGKQGFTFPFDRWMRTTLEPRLRCALMSERASDLLRPDSFERVWSNYLQRRTYWTRAWALVALQGWLDGGRFDTRDYPN